MEKLIKPLRIVIIFITLVSVLSIYVVSLYDLQINRGDEFREMSKNNINSKTTVVASRGNIYDRNGKLLVGNKVINNVSINWSVLSASGKANEVILNLVRASESHGVSYIDSLPVSAGSPFEFTDMDETQIKYMDAYKEYHNLDSDISAVELMAHLRNTYRVDPSYSAADARSIVGIRFELEMRYAKPNLSPYVFAEDVNTNFVAVIGEKNYPGIEIEEFSMREYHTTYAAHILGTTGQISSDEVDRYVNELGYPNDAYVGKSGAEKYFEEYLHGTNGTQITTTNSDGAVIGVTTEKATDPGNDVYLSIDIGLQAVAETSLQNQMTAINSSRSSSQQKALKGAAVAMNVKTGQLLAMASLPSYNLDTYYEDYGRLSEDKLKPLLNRATSEIYSPGSIFKMTTAMAALCETNVTEHTTVNCTGTYTLGGTTFGCTATHGIIDLRKSIAQSCNYYYYTMASYMNNSTLAQYASMFGLGEATGIETGEATGIMDSKAYRQSAYDADPEGFTDRNAFGEDSVNHSTGEVLWYDGMTTNAAIGQGESRFTPLQMASYVSTIANRGVRNSATILNRIETYDGSATVLNQEPKVLNTIDVPGEYWDAIQQGMRGVTESGTGRTSVLHGYEIPLAAKTGTAQTSKTEDTNTSVFVCYAPYDDPEIALSVVIENGGAGSKSIQVAYELLQAYFSSDEINMAVVAENTLLG